VGTGNEEPRTQQEPAGEAMAKMGHSLTNAHANRRRRGWVACDLELLFPSQRFTFCVAANTHSITNKNKISGGGGKV